MYHAPTNLPGENAFLNVLSLIYYIYLLPALVLGQLDVVLHADVDHVPGRAHEAADAAGEGGHPHAGHEGDRLAVRGDLLLGDLQSEKKTESNFVWSSNFISEGNASM